MAGNQKHIIGQPASVICPCSKTLPFLPLPLDESVLLAAFAIPAFYSTYGFDDPRFDLARSFWPKMTSIPRLKIDTFFFNQISLYYFGIPFFVTDVKNKFELSH